MTAVPAPDGKGDPREFRYIAVRFLGVDDRKQREVDPDRVLRIANEWDWARVEALTVAPTSTINRFVVVEGSHRSSAALIYGGPDIRLPCMVLPPTEDARQSQIALDIVKTRKPHTAYEQWRLRLHAGHPHERAAEVILSALNVRVGKAPSARTIGAVATVSRIVHGGAHSPDYGAELLGDTLEIVMGAYPTHDPESTISRWDRFLLLAVSDLVERWPDIDRVRLVKSIQIRPAIQWVNMGRGAAGMAPDIQIRDSILDIYNKNLRKKLRLDGE
jgi:hypothetical protein